MYGDGSFTTTNNHGIILISHNINFTVMAIFDLFSKRQKRLRGEVPDIYIYDKLESNLRIQVIHIIRDAIGVDGPGYNYVKQAYEFIHKTLCREYGVFSLGGYREKDEEAVLKYLLQKDVESALDIIELTFQYIDIIIRKDSNYNFNNSVELTPDDAINELNARFKEHGFGYQYESGELIRVDSTYVHSEIVKPTISLLWNAKFDGANEEYLNAHDHYKHGRHKECLNECLKAFESVMKIICKEKGWQFNQTDTSKKLIQTCFDNELVPIFVQNQFTSLKNLLESGIPTIRNKLGGHGQGDDKITVDEGITRYALNLTGTNIIFLIEQSKMS